MGWKFPADNIPQGGDDEALSPSTQSRSLLGADETGATRRVYVDSDHNLQVIAETEGLLRRLIKILESNATVDSSQRQRVVVEQVTATQMGVAITGLSSGAGVASPNAVSVAAPAAGATTTYYLPVWVGPIDQRYEFVDRARQAYELGIRSKLSFT